MDTAEKKATGKHIAHTSWAVSDSIGFTSFKKQIVFYVLLI